MTQMTATEVSRSFSEVLNRVSTGEEIEVTRGGVLVATMSPVKKPFISVARMLEILDNAPTVDQDFAADVRAARKTLQQPSDPWKS